MAFMGLFFYKQRRQDFSIKRFSISLFAHVDDKGTRFLLKDWGLNSFEPLYQQPSDRISYDYRSIAVNHFLGLVCVEEELFATRGTVWWWWN